MRLKQLSIFLAALLCGGCLYLLAAPQQKKKTSSKSSAPAKSASKTASTKGKSTAKNATKRTTTSSRRAKTYSRSRSRGPKPVAARRSYGQQKPTSDRYSEIQRALAAKGFLDGQPTGVWDSASSDAMRRFQAEQNIPATGKVTSLSLIALGLGPKRNLAETAQRDQP